MDKDREKMMADFQRLMATQEFKSMEEVQKFMEKMQGQPIPSFPNEALNAKELAQDLIFDAYELPKAKAKLKIEKALQLDPECIEAYECLGTMEQTAEIAMAFYEKGIAIGRRIFGGEYLKRHKGMFWGFHETRPFMRCLFHYSDCLHTIGELEKSAAVLEEIIELNKDDNQGVRDQLLLYLLELGDNKKFEKYAKKFKHDFMAFPLFNRALFAFKTTGETAHSNQELKKALNQNKFVAKKIIAGKPILELGEYYGIGDENEANYYVHFALNVWKNTEGAISWLKKNSSNL